MTTIKAFIKRHPLPIYFALTFAISWGVILIVVGPGGLPGTPEQFETLIPFVGLAMLAGPPVAGILLISLVHGRAGLRDLLARMVRWRVGGRWYAVALLSAPLLMLTVTPFGLSLLFPEVLPRIFTSDEKVSLVLFGIAMGLAAGVFEELGWTGFAVPTLLKLRYGVLATGLIVGLLWGAWHFLVNVWSSGTSSGAISLTLFMHSFLFSVGVLPAYRVLMVWVYERTESLLVAMLMHASLTAGNIMLVPLATGMALVSWSLVLTAALWVVVAVVAVANGGHLSRGPLRRRVA